ncbi:MAG: hypothetical protein ACYCPN_07425 [Thermoplasmata archaeon]
MVIVVLAVVGLGVAGVLPIPGLHPNGGGGGSSTPTGTPSTFATAWSQANQSVKAYGSGTWKTFFAAGIATPIASTQPMGSLANRSTSSCTATAIAGAPSTIQVPAANPTTGGLGSVWFFLYGNGSNLVILLDNGASATPILTLTGACSTTFNQYLLPLSPSVLNSPQVTQAVRSNASAFLSANSNLTTLYSVLGEFGYLGFTLPSTWSVLYTTCTVTQTSASTGNTFNATLGSTTGVVSSSHVVNNASCPNLSSGIPISASGSVPTTTAALQILQAAELPFLE